MLFIIPISSTELEKLNPVYLLPKADLKEKNAEHYII